MSVYSGFYLFHCFFYIIIISILLVAVLWAGKNKNTIASKVILWGVFLGLMGCIKLTTTGVLNQKIVLEPDDFYGSYTVNRNYFKGEQANWQYNHYRFEIMENDSIYFYHTDGVEVLDTWKGEVTYPAPYKSARLHIEMKEPIHHILESDPTIFREAWKFHVVFNSAKFGNMYFIKNEWDPID